METIEFYKDIAAKYGVKRTAISHLKNHRRFTKNIELARDMATLSGEPAINYIPPELRDVYARAYPKLIERRQHG